MDKIQALAFLNSLTPQPVNMITLDPVKWADFKTVVAALLLDPTLDPKYKKAVQEMDAIAESALG